MRQRKSKAIVRSAVPVVKKQPTDTTYPCARVISSCFFKKEPVWWYYESIMKHEHGLYGLRQGFALPTVLIASVIMLTILFSAVSSIGSASVAINNQYYNQLAREAAESGMARAMDCVQQTQNFSPQWSNASPLMPNTNCDGSVIPGASQWLVNNGNTRTSFTVGLPASGSVDSMRFAVSGNVSLVRASNQNSAWRTYAQSLAQDNRYAGRPKIAGGAGWLDSGHIAAIMTVDNQLYGFGSNDSGQIGTPNSPASFFYPQQYSLPAGVSSITKVKTSGQGASFVCILGNDSQVYCRGKGLGGGYTTWTKFVLPGSTTATDFWTDGYGNDAVCVIGSDQQGYCAGESREGSFGGGGAASGLTIYPLSAPAKFGVPAGVNLRKILPGTSTVCAISTESPYNNLYCSGRNDWGQIGGATTSSVSTPIQWPTPGYRSVKNVIISYHSMDDVPAVHVLMADGTIWGTGRYFYGDFGNGLNSGSTGTTQDPSLFDPTGNNDTWQTGIYFKNPVSGRCIDNQWGGMSNGNAIQLYDCNDGGDQRFMYQANKSLVFVSNGKCLDDPGNSSTAGVKLQLYTCNGTAAQQFVFATDSNGNPIVKHVSSGLCVDASGAGTANGTLIQLWTCSNNNPQVYTRTGVVNGWTDMITGADMFCGIRSDSWSGMWCAGNNDWGQLLNYSQPGTFFNPCAGTGTTYSAFNVNLPNGLKIDPSKLSDEWRQQFQSLQVIATDGNVYGSGRDQYGKFGTGVIGDPANDYEVCRTYNSLANMRANQPGAGAAVSTSFALPSGVTALDMSTRDQYTTYVLGSDMRIYAAGRNAMGQIGDGTTTDRLAPVMVKLPRVNVNY